MIHFFDVDVAKAYGIDCAVIFQNIGFWVEHNMENEQNYFDGCYWTFNSTKAFESAFPYMSYQKIGRAIAKLESAGLLKSGNYNTSPFDRTKWYTLTEKGYRVFRNDNSHLSNLINGVITDDKPIPDINTNINNIKKPNNGDCVKDANVMFERLWKLYPKKRGKGQVSTSKKKELLKIGYDVLFICIQRYVDDYRKDHSSDTYMMYGSTFFNSGYVDYLDENYMPDKVNDETADSIAAGGWEL